MGQGLYRVSSPLWSLIAISILQLLIHFPNSLAVSGFRDIICLVNLGARSLSLKAVTPRLLGCLG